MSVFEPTKAEREFNEWVKSIEFVDENNKIIKPRLVKDESDDLEGDREGVQSD